MVKYLELFAGGGGMSHGFERAGWECVGHAEIEPHARAVLRQRWPDTPLLGDVREVNGADFTHADVVSFGAPCQDLSVAGKRAGLQGARSSLFFEAVRIWNESGAPYAIYENVNGAFSSNNGKDFAAVLSALVGATIPVPSDGWQRGGVAGGPAAVAAWRVLDLQHFGPPQRRVRVFVVAARTGAHDPAEILALSEGVCGHPSPREQARQGTASGVGASIESGSVCINSDSRHEVVEEATAPLRSRGAAPNVIRTLTDGGRSHGAGDSYDNTPVVVALRGREGGSMPELSDEVPALRTPGGGSSHPLVVAFEPRYYTRDNKTGGAPSDLVKVDASIGKNGDAVPHIIAFDNRPQIASDGIVDTVTTEGARNPTAVVVGNSGMESWRTTDTAITLAARDAKGTNNVVVGALDFGGHGGSYNGQDAYQNRIRAEHGRPRRLTPRECERLMGWPDDFTRYGVKEDGTRYGLSDTARYRICGNGVGSPCAEWIAKRFA